MQETLENPLLRQVTPSDLADRTVLSMVVRLIQEGLAEPVSESELVGALNRGSLEAFWVLAEDGQHAGLVSFQRGFAQETQRRVFYCASMTVAPTLPDSAWERLFMMGKGLARERGCSVIEFDTLPTNKRIIEVARAAGATERIRFSLETS